jgi:hypothetical protein
MNLFGHLVGFLGWEISPTQGPTCTGQHITEKCGHTSMPRAGFEPAIPVFERSKTVHALDRAAWRIHFHVNFSRSWMGDDLFSGLLILKYKLIQPIICLNCDQTHAKKCKRTILFFHTYIVYNKNKNIVLSGVHIFFKYVPYYVV